jgi:hypothetical protein
MELRVLKADQDRQGRIIPATKYRGTYGGWSDDPDLIARWGSKVERVSAYVTINPVLPALLARSNKLAKQDKTTSDDEIERLRFTLIDLDPERPADISATEAERLAAIECRDDVLASYREIAEASMWGCSGNGGFIVVRLPDYPNDQEHRALIDRFIKSLGHRHDGEYSGVKVNVDPSTVNPARIMALVGTKKCKGESTADRPHRLVTLDSPLDESLGVFDLKAWLNRYGITEHHTSNGKPAGSTAKPKASTGCLSVFDDYDQRTKWEDILKGWSWLTPKANGEIELTRPGKDKNAGSSATIGYKGKDILHVFSSNAAPFKDGENYTKARAYAALHHGGDEKAASRALYDQGFGEWQDDQGRIHKNPRPAAARQSKPSNKLDWVETNYATLEDVDKTLQDTAYAWNLWIPKGAITAVVADPGIGKTRLAAEWSMRLWTGDTMPDGSVNPFPKGTKTLWLCYDRNWRGLVRVFTQYAVPKEAVLLPATRERPLFLPDFDRPETMDILRRFIAVHKPGWIVIDSTTYASAFNTGKPNEAKVAYDPIMDVLMQANCVGLGLTHTNREGGLLNRRFLERCRVQIMVTRPDPNSPERLRVEVTKSDDVKPPAMGATFTDSGVAYDSNPPEEPEGAKRGRKAAVAPGMAEFLWEFLQPGPATVKAIVDAARDKGLLATPTADIPKPSISPLYAARDWVERLHPGKVLHEFEATTAGGKTLKHWQIADKA